MNASIPFGFRAILSAAVCVIFLGLPVADAQINATFSGPVLGYVFDTDSQKVRPLHGVPGNAIVGTPVALGFEPNAVLILDENHVIAATQTSSELLTVNFETNPMAVAAISGVPSNPSHAAASLQGTSAAFYYGDSQQAVIVTGLPQTPVAAYRVDLSLLGKPITHMAVSNDGTLLAIAVVESGHEAVYGWTAVPNTMRFLSSAVSVSGLAITKNGAAIVTDRSANEVFAIWDAAGSAIRQTLAGDREGISSPAGVAVSQSNRIYIGNSATATVTILEPDGRYRATDHCGCKLTGVYPLRESVFRLTDRIDRTIFLLDASSADQRILFVPPAKE